MNGDAQLMCEMSEQVREFAHGIRPGGNRRLADVPLIYLRYTGYWTVVPGRKLRLLGAGWGADSGRVLCNAPGQAAALERKCTVCYTTP